MKYLLILCIFALTNISLKKRCFKLHNFSVSIAISRMAFLLSVRCAGIMQIFLPITVILE